MQASLKGDPKRVYQESPDVAAKAQAARARVTPGPAKGTKETFAGKPVQLPPDAYVEGTLVVDGAPSIHSGVTIRRGKSYAVVNTDTGKVATVQEAPGEQGTFDFLREALKGSGDAPPCAP